MSLDSCSQGTGADIGNELLQPAANRTEILDAIVPQEPRPIGATGVVLPTFDELAQRIRRVGRHHLVSVSRRRMIERTAYYRRPHTRRRTSVCWIFPGGIGTPATGSENDTFAFGDQLHRLRSRHPIPNLPKHFSSTRSHNPTTRKRTYSKRIVHVVSLDVAIYTARIVDYGSPTEPFSHSRSPLACSTSGY
jgi:hypothetical protein